MPVSNTAGHHTYRDGWRWSRVLCYGLHGGHGLHLPTGAQVRAQKQGQEWGVGVQESRGTNSFSQVQRGSFSCHAVYWQEGRRGGRWGPKHLAEIHRAHSFRHPGKTCFRHLAESLSAWAGGCRRFLSPFIIISSTWDTIKAFMLHLALQPHPILAAMSSHKAAVLSQKRLLREQLFPATSPAAPPPRVKSSQHR